MAAEHNKYSDGLIYTIKVGDKIYVGSTTNIIKREVEHFKASVAKAQNVYKAIKDNDGDWEMTEHKKYPCSCKEELRQEEERCRIELGATLNMRKCWVDKKEYNKQWQSDNREHLREYKSKLYNINKVQIAEKREANKDAINANDREYYQKNKEQIAERRKTYRENNKEAFNKQVRERYENNPEMKEKKRLADLKWRMVKIQCECGSMCSKGNLSAHRKTKKHIAFIESV